MTQRPKGLEPEKLKNSEDKSLVQGKEISEADMQCNACVWRGFQEGLPPTRCLIYRESNKPTPVIIRTNGYVCPAYRQEGRDDQDD